MYKYSLNFNEWLMLPEKLKVVLVELKKEKIITVAAHKHLDEVIMESSVDLNLNYLLRYYANHLCSNKK